MNPESGARCVCGAALPRQSCALCKGDQISRLRQSIDQGSLFGRTLKASSADLISETRLGSIDGSVDNSPSPEPNTRREQGENNAVGPICSMWNQPSTGRSPDERAQLRHSFNLSVFLEVAKGRRRFSPAIQTNDGPGKPRRGFQQCFVASHVVRCRTRTGPGEIPMLDHVDRLLTRRWNTDEHHRSRILPAEGQRVWSSHLGQSGLRAKQRRRPCQMSK